MKSLAAVILLVLAFTITGAAQGNDAANAPELVDDVQEYEGSIGPSNALYGLKLAFEKLDIAFTFNESQKLGKQVSYTRLRIAEAKAELKRNNSDAASRALAKYREDSEEVANSVSKLSDKEKGLLNAQKMIVKHQFVLRDLLNKTPNNTGLQRAYNNSLGLEKKFEEKTRVKLERKLTKQGRILEEVEIDEEREKIEVKAKILENATQVKVEVKFVTNKTENFTIADEILNKIKFASENINSLIKIEKEEEEEKLREKLEAEAEVKENISMVKFEYSFYLNATNESEIISGIQQKLLVLEQKAILDVLEMKVKIKKELEIEQKEAKKVEKREERNKSKTERGRESEEDTED